MIDESPVKVPKPTIAVVRVGDASRYGTVLVDAWERICSFAEKTVSHAPGLVNGGVYVFSQAVWKPYSRRACQPGKRCLAPVT
jgi:NDP-sugar pyrophosphorylase family protein